jgi:D-lactate dehydrogenase (cytochrome)
MARRELPSHRESMRSTTTLDEISPLPFDLSDANLNGAREEFIALLGCGAVNEHLGTLIAHSSTAWSSAPRGDLDRPCLIVYPKTTEDVSNIARICHRRRIPMIGFSGGTSLEGTLAATHREVCIDFERMDRVVEVHERDMDVVVQPGVGYEDLNRMLEGKSLFFPPDPGPGAKIGGMVAQGCSGTNAYRYGTMKDWVLGLTVVLADGTVIRTRRRARKSSAGYDLTRLIVGSEGTLGLVTEASLRLTNKPENVQVAVAGFGSVHQAVDTVIKILQSGHQLAAMELLDATTMYAINEGGYSNKTWPQVPTLFLKFSGTPVSVKEQVKVAQRLAKASGCSSFEFSRNDEEAAGLWQARKTALWSLLAIKENPEDRFLSADVAVPVSRLGDIIEATQKRLTESGLIGSCLGHVGDGTYLLCKQLLSGSY